MEVLNKNQRESALWRLFGLWVIILGCIGAFLYATHENYANQGVSDLEKRIRELEDKIYMLEGKNQGLKNDKSNLESKVFLLQGEIKDKDKIIGEKERDLRDCKDNLKTMQLLKNE